MSGELQTKEPIVFFDGVCSLCNSFVDFLVRVDQAHHLRFASLQGTTAAQLLKGIVPTEVVDDLQSVIFYRNGRVFLRSAAVLEIMRALGRPWSLALLAYAIPAPIRDSLYRFVAAHRYKIFGKRETCRLPTREERALFFD